MLKVDVAPVMLEWACRHGGLDEQTLLRDFPMLPQWKTQEIKPTFKQLEKFAQKNQVPFGMLFLSSPPAENESKPRNLAVVVFVSDGENTYKVDLTPEEEEQVEDLILNLHKGSIRYQKSSLIHNE
jgi:hypothetical protein